MHLSDGTYLVIAADHLAEPARCRCAEVGDLAQVDQRPALSVQSFWASEYREPVAGRQAADLQALIEALPRLVGA
jgi:hypothetical protein